MDTYTIDLSLQPSVLDSWHAGLLASNLILALLLIIVLFIALFSAKRQSGAMKELPPAQPEIRVVEKIVEVEKIVQQPAPEPIVLKEASNDAALQLLSLLQNEARFIDFVQEDMTRFSDAEIGAAARIVHQGCVKTLREHFSLSPVSDETEGNRITLTAGFDAAKFRLTGNITGQAPFTGTLVHKGWQASEVRLPKLTAGHNANIIAPAEVEL